MRFSSVPGAVAKRERIDAIRRNSSDDAFIVYVGDSSTDLLALCCADVGILMGNSTGAMQMAERWGICIRPICSYNKDEENTTGSKQSSAAVIWQASNWKEIETLLKQTV
jgi:magnesium-transporting ATPase (P-type)